MYFYFVKKGDTLSSISKEYHIPIATLVSDNDISNKNQLSVGQCLLIDNQPVVYIVKRGDNLYKIASDYHVSIENLKKWNPGLTDDLSVGQKIRITYRSNSEKESIKVNGYCYPGTNIDVISRTLPYLTYLSIFAYRADEDGNLDSIMDDRIIELARDNDVAPIMVITNIKEKGGFSSKIASSIINDEQKTNNLFNNILNVLARKNYYGLNIDFEYVYQNDKDSFEDFLRKAYSFFTSNGYFMTTALAPKTSSSQKGLLYEAHNYQVAGENSDLVILMTYEWGYTYGDSMPVSPVNNVENVIKYAVGEIPSEKILMGIPNYGYDFNVPKIEGKPAKSLSLKSANSLAFEKGAAIKYYEKEQTPYFTYRENGINHEVQFDNVYSFYRKLELVDKYKLGGISIWTITTFNTPYYKFLKSLFIIEKVL